MDARRLLGSDGRRKKRKGTKSSRKVIIYWGTGTDVIYLAVAEESCEAEANLKSKCLHIRFVLIKLPGNLRLILQAELTLH